MNNLTTSSPLQNKVTEYQTWRADLLNTITAYRDSLSGSAYSDSVIELRLHDILETLKRDQLVVVFLAEFSRGKTETINALFFSDFNQRLLPSEAGRTTMCPTEIFWDESDEPSIKLLPIHTRESEDALTYLKTVPNIWEKYRLDTNSPDTMKLTLQKLIEEIEVTQSEAESLGLWNPDDTSMVNSLKQSGRVKVPAWRHAMINFPHPLLKSGLVVIDTPGLNTLGAEPELTLSIIPSAHVVLFLTATDSGITKSDMSIWNEYIKGRAKHKIVVMNKIDILWDEMRPKQDVINEIDRQLNVTSHQLGMSPENVFAISAQKALVARIKKNTDLLKESRILELEQMLGSQMIQAKHEIFGRTIANDCSEMIKNSRKLLQKRVSNIRAQLLELRSLRGQNFDNSRLILNKVMADRKRYEATIPTFNLANDKINRLGHKLLRHLSVAYLDNSIAQSRQEMGDSWTTMGLNQGMRNLMKQAIELAAYVSKESKTIQKLAENIYKVFEQQHGFDFFDTPELNMTEFLNNMRALEKITEDFCTDPVNVLTEKHFLIRRFFMGLGAQKQRIFEQASKDVQHWLEEVLSKLKTQMAEHKNTLDSRMKSLMEAKTSAEAVDNQLALIEKEYVLISNESQALDTMLLHLITSVKPAVKAKIVDKNSFGIDKTMQMPDLTFLSVNASQAITPSS